ncbi:YqhG family protein [Paenibacillus sp. GCM10023252]|uniref:YqhG family protein n=1 Tax=Paenibacillus sp. GCM10023252 TaxID=3252649 RepID=UPI00361EA549
MNEKLIHKFVHRYLEATGCTIVEKSPAHFTVKLSPQADRQLTNRPYYWSFVDRTGAEPETMSYLLVIDKDKYDAAMEEPAKEEPPADAQEAAAQSIIGRSLGYVHGSLNTVRRIPREDLHFGSRKLEQLFDSSREGGSYVYLFQEPDRRAASPLSSVPYTAWLGVNMKVEFACDRKREEIHSFGVSLATGHCVEGFHEQLLGLKLTPRLPANVHLTKNGISYSKALAIMEGLLEKKLKTYDYSWAADAAARLQEELERVEGYFEPLLASALEENREPIQEQYTQRLAEIKWQYEPRVTASTINCGIFHLAGID